jgi:hypothetical protein
MDLEASMTMQWETVHIFIRSTFDDMHAERDYLVKQVFPELREWCERRKLRLLGLPVTLEREFVDGRA